LKNLKRKLLIGFGVGLCITIFGIMAPDRAHAVDEVVQVVISPAQQAVNTAIGIATTEVQQAIDATASATTEVVQAQIELSGAQAAAVETTASVSTAQTSVNNVQNAINTINTIDLAVNPVDQSFQVIQDAKATVTNAQEAINNISITTTQTEISQLTTARSEAVTAQATAQTELTQANIAIDNAQNAVNALQATIGTSTNVLSGVDDAGVRMNLPFNLLMGQTLYNNVYVGSNATITFGVNEGQNYYSTPNAPSISIAGWDWTTWSSGTGITYATTGTSLDIAWDVRPFPQQDASTQMVQIRFNADVNPTDGAWMANVTAVGPIPNQARFNYRETTNGQVFNITDTNSGSGFAGQISQGTAFIPYVDPNTSTVQASVDTANAIITQLNQSLSPVVAQNTSNNYVISALGSSITSLNNTVNFAVSTKNTLQTTLDTKANTLTTAINNNIPTPAPILAEPTIEGTTVTIAPELPVGFTANTWFYQVITEDPTAENPYAGGTYNTDGAPSSIQLTGLTEGATYTIRVANWSGPVSNYTETVISIPAPQSSNLTGGGISEPPAVNPPAEEPPAEEPPAEEPPAEEPPAEEPPAEEPPVEEPPSEEPPAVEEEAPLTVEEIISVVEDLVADGNLTAADAEAVLDALMSDGEITSSEINTLTDQLISDGTLSANESALIVDALSADGEITNAEVNNLSDALTADGTFTLAEKDLVAEVLVASAEGEPVTAANIEAAGLEYRDLPPQIPVEVRQDLNGNPVVITAEVASSLLTLESPAALVGAIAGCFNPDEAIEGLTEEQKCEVFLALASIGADMSTQERQKAKEVLVAAVLVGQIIVGSAMIRRR
jgi:polyhydroxyalkanoate synthesis regulator phasin